MKSHRTQQHATLCIKRGQHTSNRAPWPCHENISGHHLNTNNQHWETANFKQFTRQKLRSPTNAHLHRPGDYQCCNKCMPRKTEKRLIILHSTRGCITGQTTRMTENPQKSQQIVWQMSPCWAAKWIELADKFCNHIKLKKKIITTSGFTLQLIDGSDYVCLLYLWETCKIW